MNTKLIAGIVGGIILLIIILYVSGVFSSSQSSSGSNSSSNPGASPGSASSATCTSTANCSGGTVCQNGQCVTSSTCGAGPACPTGQTCQNGSCVDSTTICSPACVAPQICQSNTCTTPPACTTGSCPNNQTCTNSVCVCSGDDQCATGQWCNNGACVTDACATMAISPDGLACFHSTYQNCVNDKECPTGTTCDTTNGGYCIPPTCKKDTDCVNTNIYTCGNTGVCEITTCSMQSHCGPGFYCSGGKCNKINTCNSEYPCTSPTETCYNGMCMPLCNYTATNTCATGQACVPKYTGSNFNPSNTDGVCLTVDPNNPHSGFSMPVGIQCATSNDCPDQWACTSGECQQYTVPATCSTTDSSNLPPNYHCLAGVPTLNPYAGCSRWQQLDISNPTGTCSSMTWNTTDAVPLACLGQDNNTKLQPNPIGYWGAQTNTGSSYFMTPVVFRLAGPGAPGYPLYGFYNSNTSTGLAFTTYDLGGWLSFDHTGALFDTAKNSIYKDCYVTEAAYIAMDTTNQNCVNQHIPAWKSNMWNEQPFTYDGVPFCYNTQEYISNQYVPSTFSGVRADLGSTNNYCVQPSDIWGPTGQGPASGSLATMMVYNSDGGNNNNTAH